ncbi:hypothetical protein [Roseovarius sp. Pro17]|uniref:hypothetical protein n=1 Tax=Roseovarius sp. Pro17 TaxID=3108175 RepID=UPI002D78C486|nr:hypothetical protein [Roseovarius sp. Pro17]
MIGLPPILTILLIAAFCVGAGVFCRTTMRRGRRAALIGWGLCGAAVMALGWGAFAMQVPPRTAIFTGLILPVWLIGALVGLMIGLIRQSVRK